MKWLTRESFSERRFSGWTVYIKRITLIAWLAGCISELALARGAAVLFDVTSVALFWPMMLFGSVCVLAWACQRLWNMSFVAALAGLEEYLPLALLVPLLEIIGGEGGVRTQKTFVGAWSALTSLITGGIIPMIAPPALACVWIGALAWIGYAWWRSTEGRTPFALARGLAPAYLLFGSMPLIPSAMGWMILAGHAPLAKASASLVEQAFVATHVDGYAWRAIYERFPLALRGEAHVSAQWFLLSLGLLIFGGLMGVYLVKGWRWSIKSLKTFVSVHRIRMIGGSVLVGSVLALLLQTTPVWGWTHILAALILLVTIVVTAMHQASVSDLDEAIKGVLPADRPLARGEMRASDLRDAHDIWQGMGLIGAWLLGLPVFLAYILAIITASQEVGAQSSWARHGLRAASQIGYILMGWMVVAERGSFGSLAPSLALLIALLTFVAQRALLHRRNP